MLAKMADRNPYLLAMVLTVLIQDKSSSQVVAELANDAIYDDRRLIHGGWDTDKELHLYAHVNLKWQEEGHQVNLLDAMGRAVRLNERTNFTFHN